MWVLQSTNNLARADNTDKVKKALIQVATRSSLKEKAGLRALTSTPRVKMMLELKAGMVKEPRYLMPSPVKIWAPALNHTGSCKNTAASGSAEPQH